MTYKIHCPGCGGNTTDIARGYQEVGKCPECGLSQDTLHEIWRARESHANDELKAKFEAMAVRAGVAEAKALKLERRLEHVQDAVNGGYDHD